MRAFSIELDYITIGVNYLLDNWEIVILTYRNGSFRVSVEYFKSLYVTEL